MKANDGNVLLDHVLIRDKVNSIPSLLSKFNDTFGIHELKKGYFPFLFNTPDHQIYVSDITDSYF